MKFYKNNVNTKIRNKKHKTKHISAKPSSPAPLKISQIDFEECTSYLNIKKNVQFIKTRFD